MTKLAHLRTAAREIFDEALRSADAADAVRRVIKFSESHFSVCDVPLHTESIYAVAIGKAALSMSHALEQSLGQFFNGGILTGPSPNLAQVEWLSKSRWNWYVGGHPFPNRESLSAAADAVGLLQRANRERASILFLISGGGSAMMEWPANPNVSLSDLQEANRTLVNCGASISEINSVRRAFSAVKGGKLASRAPNCDQITLIVSDVPDGEEFNVASGPTIKPRAGAPNPLDVIAHYNLRPQLPANIIEAIESQRDFQTESNSLREQFVLLTNDNALQSAATVARQHGCTVEIASEIADQQIADGCEQLIERLTELRSMEESDSPVCLISGGEFACPVKGDGIGGRNLETALRLAMLHAGSDPKSEFAAICAGTDGIDGNSVAAGAILDSTTIERATLLGLNPQDFLDRSDAFSFFAALDDVITNGPTGTNVRDVRILLSAR
jgi:hydroxypyruvate reductase